jgi:hypothetical protein
MKFLLALMAAGCILASAAVASPPGQEEVRISVREYARGAWETPRVFGPAPGRSGVYTDGTGIALRESLLVDSTRTFRVLTLDNTTSRDRFLTLRVSFRIEVGDHPRWHDDILHSRPIDDPRTVYQHVVEARTIRSPDGALNDAAHGGTGHGGYGDAVGTGWVSPYPFSCVTGDRGAAALGIDPTYPVVFRLLALAGEELAAEFDLALPSSRDGIRAEASVRIVRFEIDPAWGFRSAAEKFYELFPASYLRRTTLEGTWLPFTPVHDVRGWEDFGFAFHETQHGTRTTVDGRSVPVEEADRTAGVLSFQYTEPWDIQVPVEPAGVTFSSLRQVAAKDSLVLRQVERSATMDRAGQWMARVISAPWFSPPWAVSFTTDAAPDALADSRSSSVRAREVVPAIEAGFDGIYFDSLEFFWHHDLNYRPEHLRAARYPLTFSASLAEPAPAIWTAQSQYAFLDDVCSGLHATGKLTMGNGFTWIAFPASQLDVLGTEFSWFMSRQEKERVSAFRRTVCGQKPVVLLLNEGLYTDDFLREPYDGYRRYFEESLFFGLYPSFFSADAANDPYWKNPRAYDIGRPFFKRYVPVIRLLNSQGWRPVTLARSSAPELGVERFDRPGDDTVLFTIRNATDRPISGAVLTCDPALGADLIACTEVLHGSTVSLVSPRAFRVDLAPASTIVVQCTIARAPRQ